MAERFSTNVPPSMVPSQQARQHSLYPIPGASTNQRLQAAQYQTQQPYPHQQYQQVYSHPYHPQYFQQQVHSVPQVAQPLTPRAGQIPQRRASLRYGHGHSPTNVQFPAQSQAQRLPQPSFSSSDQALRDRVVSLLASTANGCITELGYPSMLNRLKQLQTEQARLIEECSALRAENSKLKGDFAGVVRLVNNEREEHRKKAESSAKTIQDLNAEISQLRGRMLLLTQQCRVLQQTSNLDAPEAYKILESKYLYVLELLKKFHISCSATEPPKADAQNRLLGQAPTGDARSENSVNPVMQGSIQSAGSSLQSQNGIPAETLFKANSSIQQPRQGSSAQPSRNMSSAPPVLSGQTSDSPQHIPTVAEPIRSTSLPASSSVAIFATPTVQVFPKPVHHFVDNASDALVQMQDQQHSNSASTSSSIPEQVHMATPLTNVSVLAGGSSHTIITQESSSESAAPRRSTPQSLPAGPAAHSDANNEVAVVSAEERPQLFVQTSFEDPARHVTPTPLGAKATELASIPSRRASPAPAPGGPTPVDVEIEKTVDAQQPPMSPGKSPTPSPSIPLTPKDSQMMEVDDDGEVRGTEVDNKDIVMSECEVPSGAKENSATGTEAVPVPSPGDNLAPAQPSNSNSEEEEEAEQEREEAEEEEPDWDDLTDVDDNEKRPVFDCISNIFEDDEKDDRMCTFCNIWLERENNPGPRPLFTDCSLRDLVLHAKTEHEVVWRMLRRYEE